MVDCKCLQTFINGYVFEKHKIKALQDKRSIFNLLNILKCYQQAWGTASELDLIEMLSNKRGKKIMTIINGHYACK